MSKILVLYYSRTGTSAKVAQSLAKALDATVEQISCEKYRGVLGYVRAAYDSLKRRLPVIELPDDYAPDDYDCLVIGGPIWTSYPAAPLRAFLDDNQRLPQKMALFLTYGGHSPPEKALKDIEVLLGSQLEEHVFVREKDVDAGSSPEGMADFIDRLKKR